MKVVRVGLCLLFAFCVLAHGAVEVWSVSLLEIGSSILLLVWAISVYRDGEAKVFWNVLNWPLLGFIAIGLLQLLFRGSAYPFLTKTELLKLTAFFIVFFLTTQAYRNRSSLEALAWFLILFCFAVSLLGIIQHFTSEDKIYWFREPAEGGAIFGPFVNRNHFAGFLELVLPVGLALMAFRGIRRDLFPLVTLLTVVPLSALILSGSRGGIIGFAFEISVLALLVRTRRTRGGPHMAGVAIVALAAVALIAWVGAGKAIERFSTLKPSEVTLDRRVSMFRGAVHIFLDHPFKGSGLGTLIAVYPRYETLYDGKVIDHAHDDYVETLADTGLLGGLCGMAFLWLLYREARKRFEAEQGHFSRGLHAAAIVALSGMLLHSFLDFNLHIPSNALLFLLQAYIVTSPPLPTEAHTTHHHRHERIRTDTASQPAP
jgi:O-antigen ligase